MNKKQLGAWIASLVIFTSGCSAPGDKGGGGIPKEFQDGDFDFNVTLFCDGKGNPERAGLVLFNRGDEETTAVLSGDDSGHITLIVDEKPYTRLAAATVAEKKQRHEGLFKRLALKLQARCQQIDTVSPPQRPSGLQISIAYQKRNNFLEN